MSSILFSTTCHIKTKPYELRLCIDANSDQSFETSNMKSSIELVLKPLTNEKIDSSEDNNDRVPNTVSLNKLVSIKSTAPLSNESSSSTISQRLVKSTSLQSGEELENNLAKSTEMTLSYIDISEIFIWSVERIQLQMKPVDAQQFYSIITRHLSTLKNRPQHLLVFVNPQCGKDQGRSLYEEQVLPLFEEANINVKTIYTEQANHARDYISEQSIDDYDGLVSVGGDGMFAELCESLLLKTAQHAGINIDDSSVQLKRPSLRIGVIPAGSTDAVSFGTTGHNDPITSALQIIAGESLLIDIATIHSERGFVRFMATMFTYGFFGNIIRQSNRWRILGPLRYTLAGIFQVIRNKAYHTKLTIYQQPEQINSRDSHTQHSVDDPEQQREISSENPQENESDHSANLPPGIPVTREGHYKTINCLNMPGRCDKSKYGMSPSVHLGDGSFDLILVKRSWSLGFLRFLQHIAKEDQKVEKLSNVERFRTTEVIVQPIVSHPTEKGNWACDGELIKANEVRIRAHHQALNLFASGIHLEQIKKINNEDSKVFSKSIPEVFQWIHQQVISPLRDTLTESPSWFFILSVVFIVFIILYSIKYVQ